MLLNPSHTITFSGLPPDVLDTYVRYKKGTRAIFQWLSQHAQVETQAAYSRAKTLPITDLAKLAGVTSKHVQCMPDVVHFHFRETIAARSSLSKYFRRQNFNNTIDLSTVNHEYFTTSLSEIYASLCEFCGEPSGYCKRPIEQAGQAVQPLTNHFSHLSIEDCSCSDEEHEAVSPTACDSCDASNTTPMCPSSDPNFRLSGDDLGDTIETITIVQQICALYRANQDMWYQASADCVSLVVASAITNVACPLLWQLESQLREIDPAVDLASLHRTCGLTQSRSSFEYETRPTCDDQHQMLEDMHASWKTTMHFKGGHLMPKGAACIHKPADYLNSPDFVAMLAQGILYLATNEAARDAVTRNGTPVYAELGDFLSRPDNSNNVRCTFALHLLSTSYKAYISGLKSPAMLSGCRISALRLSQQAELAVSAVLGDKICFPCRCPDTISYHLDQLRKMLQGYTAHKCWNIFFQAPWVAGNHILEILDMCFYYGMRLIRYRHYVGSILHSYNVLRQLAAMEEVPILEELCKKMASVFFPGGHPPNRRFAASWARFIGARLKFRKGHKGYNHRESWCMAVPSHAAKRAAGFGIKIDDKMHTAEDTGISVVLDLKRKDYHVDRNCFQDLGSYLSQDMRGRLPTLRLNLFALFESCAKIISRISNATHTDPKDKELRCICFATKILSGGDRIRDNEAMGRPDCWKNSDGERKLVEDAKKAIREVMASLKEDEWLWNV